MKRLATIATSKHIIIHCIKYYSKRDLFILGFFIISSALTFYLGTWQLNKGFSTQNIKATKKISRLQGTWLSKFLLLDNRTHNTLAGYWVFVPFKDSKTAAYYWVRIGFLPFKHRDDLAILNQLDFIDGKHITIEVQSLDWINPIVWGEHHIQKLNLHTIRVQKLDQVTLSKSVQLLQDIPFYKTHLNSLLSLTSDMPKGFYAPKISNIIYKSHKHFGYALQWFLLSAIPLVFFIRFITKQEKHL